MEKHFAVSGFVMNQSHTKLLMVYHKKMGIWVIPGGHLEENKCLIVAPLTLLNR